MPDNVFLDTNILVYAYDHHEPRKQMKAQGLLKSGINTGSAVLSSQVLGGFFVVVTQRIKSPLSAGDALRIIELLSIFPVVDIDLALVRSAVENHRSYGASYWDALIVAAAKRFGCSKILFEDLKEGQWYNGVVVVNPFL